MWVIHSNESQRTKGKNDPRLGHNDPAFGVFKETQQCIVKLTQCVFFSVPGYRNECKRPTYVIFSEKQHSLSLIVLFLLPLLAKSHIREKIAFLNNKKVTVTYQLNLFTLSIQPLLLAARLTIEKNNSLDKKCLLSARISFFSPWT